MILFINVYLTEPPALQQHQFPRGNYLNYSKIDIFKYSLSSLSECYPWSKVIIFYSLADEYKHYEDDLNQYVKEEYQHTNLILRNTRNEYQKQWQETYDLFDEDLIFYLGNHDHIFIGNEVLFQKAITELETELPKQEYMLSCNFSHFSERFYGGMDSRKRGMLNNKHDYIHHTFLQNVDAIQILTKKLYHHWWFDWFNTEYSNSKIGRTDGPDRYLNSCWKTTEGWHATFGMNQEHFRHFDAYGHIGISQNIHSCLNIPVGYFNSNINIKMGYPQYDNKSFNINIYNENNYTHDTSGTDFRYYHTNLPNHIKKRTKTIDIHSAYSPSKSYNQQVLKNRLYFIYNALSFLSSILFHCPSLTTGTSNAVNHIVKDDSVHKFNFDQILENYIQYGESLSDELSLIDKHMQPYIQECQENNYYQRY